MKVVFVEPPKEQWFVMGEYLPPPYGIIQLAAYLEREVSARAIHAVMPTEALSTKEVQEQLYECYRTFYGSWGTRLKGLFSSNNLKRRVHWYMATRAVTTQLKALFQVIHMPSVSPERFMLIFSIAISTFGLVSTVVIALVSPTVIIENFLLRKPLIGSIFALICLCGMIAVLFPRKCSEICDSQKKSELTTPHVKNVNSCATVQGHHPDCGEFSCHVLNFGRHSLCAACTGLFVGAIMALVGTVFYFFTNWNVGEPALLIVFFGVTGITLGFLQLRFKGIVRLALNTCFVFGAFLAIMGIDRSVGSVLLDLFLVALIFFWILTRILLSQWDHGSICRRCTRHLRYTKRKKGVSMSSPHSIKSGNHQKNARAQSCCLSESQKILSPHFYNAVFLQLSKSFAPHLVQVSVSSEFFASPFT